MDFIKINCFDSNFEISTDLTNSLVQMVKLSKTAENMLLVKMKM